MSRKTTRSSNKVPPKTHSTPPARSAKSAAVSRSRKAAAETAPPTGSKQSRLIALLKAPAGATIEQMMALTGWRAHTLRGTISGVLRKRLGLSVMCAAALGDNTRIYRIVDRMGA